MHLRLGVPARQPLLALLRVLLREGQLERGIRFSRIQDLHLVDIQLREIFFGLTVGASAQPLVVLDGPALQGIGLGPDFEILGGEEAGDFLLAGSHLDQGGDEEAEKPFDFEQGGPQVVEEVDQQPADMCAVYILVGHDHKVRVPECLAVRVDPAHLQAHDFDQVVDLLVGSQGGQPALPDVHDLALQGKHAVPVPAQHLDTRHCQGLCRITLG